MTPKYLSGDRVRYADRVGKIRSAHLCYDRHSTRYKVTYSVEFKEPFGGNYHYLEINEDDIELLDAKPVFVLATSDTSILDWIDNK